MERGVPACVSPQPCREPGSGSGRDHLGVAGRVRLGVWRPLLPARPRLGPVALSEPEETAGSRGRGSPAAPTLPPPGPRARPSEPAARGSLCRRRDGSPSYPIPCSSAGVPGSQLSSVTPPTAAPHSGCGAVRGENGWWPSPCGPCRY